MQAPSRQKQALNFSNCSGSVIIGKLVAHDTLLEEQSRTGGAAAPRDGTGTRTSGRTSGAQASRRAPPLDSESEYETSSEESEDDY